ncbi:MAG: Uma2 family endonuclease [Cyanobacteria bacterium J06635_1]
MTQAGTERLVSTPDKAEILEEAVGLFNHSYLQIRLGKVLDSETYTACAELSLDTSELDFEKLEVKLRRDEVKPDISLYPKRGLSRPRDILRMKEMPLLVVEILSPRQGTDEILEKFQVYFALGIRSCWLVDPALETIAVYASMTDRTIFSTGDIVDDDLKICASLSDIFV